MIERPVREFSKLHELMIALHDANNSTRNLIRGLLWGMGARHFIYINSKEELNDIPARADIAVLLSNVGGDISAGEIAATVRRGQVNLEPGIPMIAYAFYPTINHLKTALGEYGFDEFLAVPITVRSLHAKLFTSLCRPRPIIVEDNYVGPDNSKAITAMYDWLRGRGA